MRRFMPGRKSTSQRTVDTVLAASQWPGYAPQNVVVPVAVTAIMYALRGPWTALWQFVALGAVPIGWAVKRVVRRPRPPTAYLPFRRWRGSSFPSTHTARYAAFFGFAGWALLARPGRARLAGIIPLALTAVIGPARVRSGDHRPSDVVGGYLIGGGYLAALLALLRRLDRSRLRTATAHGRSQDTFPTTAAISDGAPSWR